MKRKIANVNAYGKADIFENFFINFDSSCSFPALLLFISSLNSMIFGFLQNTLHKKCYVVFQMYTVHDIMNLFKGLNDISLT